MHATGVIVALALASSCFRLLLVPAYHSTDMEVHRHWLALTAGRPLRDWYWDTTSTWSLDYPPLFAYVTRGLAAVARLVAPEVLTLSATAVESPRVIAFMRASAVASDSILVGGLLVWASYSGRRRTGGSVPGLSTAVAAACVLFNAGLVAVDAVHFQYNGMLIGVFIAVAALLDEGLYMAATAAFMSLLLLKQLFLTCVPVVGVILLRWYVVPRRSAASTSWPSALYRTSIVAFCVAAIAVAVLGPVLYSSERDGQRPPSANALQLLHRLFPFGRGLVHAVWAPNVWAVYMALDRVLAAMCRIIDASSRRLLTGAAAAVCDSMRGVGGARSDSSHLEHQQRLLLLPHVSPLVSAMLVLALQAPVLWLAWQSPSPTPLSRAVVTPPSRGSGATALRLLSMAYLAAFIGGYHVHEKAVLYALVPALLATAAESTGTGRTTRRRAAAAATWAREVLLLTVPAHLSLSPLFFTPMEQPLLLLLTATYIVALWLALRHAHGATAFRCEFGPGPAALPAYRQTYIVGCALLYGCAHASAALVPSLPFLPLGAIALYSAVGIVEGYLRLVRAQIDTQLADANSE